VRPALLGLDLRCTQAAPSRAWPGGPFRLRLRPSRGCVFRQRGGGLPTGSPTFSTGRGRALGVGFLSRRVKLLVPALAFPATLAVPVLARSRPEAGSQPAPVVWFGGWHNHLGTVGRFCRIAINSFLPLSSSWVLGGAEPGGACGGLHLSSGLWPLLGDLPMVWGGICPHGVTSFLLGTCLGRVRGALSLCWVPSSSALGGTWFHTCA